MKMSRFFGGKLLESSFEQFNFLLAKLNNAESFSSFVYSGILFIMENEKNIGMENNYTE
jgi:hypothetical protein